MEQKMFNRLEDFISIARNGLYAIKRSKNYLFRKILGLAVARKF